MRKAQFLLIPASAGRAGHIIGFIGLILPPLAVFSPLASAPVLVAGAIMSCAALRFLGGRWPGIPLVPAWVLGLTLLWAAISLGWTLEPVAETAGKLIRLAATCLAGLCLIGCASSPAEGEHALLRKLLLAGISLAVVLLAVEFLAGAPILRLLAGPLSPYWPDVLDKYDRGLVVLVLFFWPAFAIAMGERPRHAILLLAAVASVVLLASNAAAALGLLLGAVAAILATLIPRFVATSAAILMAAAILAGPLLARFGPLPEERPLEAAGSMTNSIDHRLIIWRFAADRISERPYLGWGYNASRSIPGGDRLIAPTAALMPLHPHNAGLQLWLELGVVGALMGVAFIIWPVWRIGRARLRPHLVASALGLAVSAFTIAELSFGIWQSWWVATLFLSGTLMVAVSRADGRTRMDAVPSAPASR